MLRFTRMMGAEVRAKVCWPNGFEAQAQRILVAHIYNQSTWIIVYTLTVIHYQS